jgi:GTP-binding protein
MEYIKGDEYLEVTPKSLRLRKIFLDENERKKNQKAS